ncbi:MAG TPA: hypothetical protein EYO33_26660 [Phycisphaerales bacterium]|nr:hypothetical protein [Phycisphaerales bacterium]
MTDLLDDHDDGEAEPWDLLANALGTLSEIEDEPEGLDVVEGSDATADPNDPFYKVPLEKAGNLLKLRRVTAGLSEGTVTREKFLAVVRKFMKPLDDGLKLLESEAVTKQIEGMPDEQLLVFHHLQDQLDVLLEGLEIMFEYRESGDMADVERGMALVEKAMVALDTVQDRAIELGREEALREEATEV